MKKTTIILIICIMSSMTGYGQSKQPKVFGESPLKLENFDFNLNIKEFYPEAKQYGTIYVPLTNALLIDDYEFIEGEEETLLIKKEVVTEEWYLKDSPPKWIEYRQEQYNNISQLAIFDEYTFNGVDIVTTLNDEVMLIYAVDTYGTEEKNLSFLHLLNKKYGNAVQTTERSFGQDYDIYTWELNDRIIKYTMTYPVGATLIVATDKQEIASIENNQRKECELHFYIIKKEYADKLIGNFHTGGLTYCK